MSRKSSQSAHEMTAQSIRKGNIKYQEIVPQSMRIMKLNQRELWEDEGKNLTEIFSTFHSAIEEIPKHPRSVKYFSFQDLKPYLSFPSGVKGSTKTAISSKKINLITRISKFSMEGFNLLSCLICYINLRLFLEQYRLA